MSYSDYGGFAWKVLPDGTWERYPAAEDGTLTGVEAPRERPLEAAYGLKFDVLLNAYKAQGLEYGKDAEKQSAEDWVTKHPHHCVLGGMEGIGLAGHKGSVTITADGKSLKSFPTWPEWDSKLNSYLGGKRDPYDEEDEEKINLGNWKYALKAVRSPSCSTMMLLVRPDGTVYAGVSGYGIGDHWWKDEDGYEHIRPGDRMECFPKERSLNMPRRSKSHARKHKPKGGSRYFQKSPVGMTLEEVKELEKDYNILWCWDSEAAEEDMKRFGTEDKAADLGRKPMEPWPSCEEWLKRVREWASPILAEWKGGNGCPSVK